MREVKGRVAFITGGAGGIGLGVARAFDAAGMKVVPADIRADHLAAARSAFSGQRAMAEAAEEAARVAGPVDVLCNNAGSGIPGEARLATHAGWDWGMAVNLGGVINGIRTFLPRMPGRGQGGQIVDTASIGALPPMPGGARTWPPSAPSRG